MSSEHTMSVHVPISCSQIVLGSWVTEMRRDLHVGGYEGLIKKWSSPFQAVTRYGTIGSQNIKVMNIRQKASTFCIEVEIGWSMKHIDVTSCYLITSVSV